jgi:hypothetical protein
METEKTLSPEEMMLEALKRLNKHEDFIIWREQVAKPLITQWEAKLSQAETMTEVEVRSTLKHLITIKELFYTWFENIK